MSRLLVNDCMTTIPGTKTFWNDLYEWFRPKLAFAAYNELVAAADEFANKLNPGLIIRNATYFGPLKSSLKIPTISLLQDIIAEGPVRKMQLDVAQSSKAVVFNSEFTKAKYPEIDNGIVIPLPVDFSTFRPGNAMGLQQAASLPDGAVCWIGACLGSAGQVKGWEIFLNTVRMNPDIPFVAILKDGLPEYGPPNLKMYARLDHVHLVDIIGACKVGLCTSRSESQHLAGIEMGACGLPLVVSPVGCYWERDDVPGVVLSAKTQESITLSLRSLLREHANGTAIRAYWEKQFSVDAVRPRWESLVKDVERDADIETA